MGQKIFRKGLVNEFLSKVSKDDRDFISLYYNKNNFKYNFNNSLDFVDSDIPEIASDLGEKMAQIFLENLKDEKTNDFRNADFECAKFLFESLKLTPRQASNAELWNYLHHTVLYKYIHLRWNKIHEQDGEELKTYIHRHWLMDRSSQKHLINFPLTTLWWSIYVTIDYSKENPFDLAKLYFQNNRYRTVTFGGSSFVRHKDAILGILEYLNENNLQPTTELGNEISKFINLLGGTKPLSYFKRNWFKEKLYEYYGKGEDLPKMKSNKEEKEKKLKLNQFTNSRTLKFFNINPNGNYCLSDLPDKNYVNSISITERFSNGYLLLCYNELGFINRVTVSSILQKKRDSYQNGLYNGNTLKKLLLIPEKAIIGITYKQQGLKYFKAHISDNFKKNNDIIGLQGYKTLYTDYDEGSIDYDVFPIELFDKIERLVFDSLQAAGKAFTNNNYKKEFEIINNFLDKSPTLFDD